MHDLSGLVPGPPDWSVEWDRIDAAFAEVSSMRDTPHDPVHHAEGCPWRHTRLVCERMAQDEDFRSMPAERRTIAFLTAALHDIGKPATAATDDAGRVSHPGHSRLGASMARLALWSRGCAPSVRERVCSAILRHQVPFWALERDHASLRRFLVGTSLTCGNDLLAVQAAADARGRVSPDRTRLIESVDLYRIAAEDDGCLADPFSVADGYTLRAFMASPETIDPTYPLPRARSMPLATVMSGLPGAGKSTWLARNAPEVPVVSLDAIRERLGIRPDRPQGAVIAAAKEEARSHLRSRRNFAWDGTNLSHELRDGLLAMIRDYGFRTRLVAVEASPEEIAARFVERGRAVPQHAFERLLRRWEYPDPWEADEVISECYSLPEAPSLAASAGFGPAHSF